MKEVREPDPATSRTYTLSVADLCKVLDQTNHRNYVEKETEKVPQKHLEAVMKMEDLKKQTATIESSEVKTYAGGDD